ncbi:MAG: lipid kinase [Rhodospirillaceae bacterium]|nr:lipid kinase [Rhodospirillales bacterium]
MPSRALMFVNANSRSGGQDLSTVLEVLRAAGMAVECHDCPAVESFSAVIAAQAPGHDVIIIGGGDGTLNAALEGLVACGLPLGLLPLGTANDLARTLGIPTNLAAAAQAIAGGRVARIDLGWVNGKHFVNVASLGLSVAISRALTGELKRRWGRFGYAWAALAGWQRTKAFPVRIRCDGKWSSLSALQVAVGNGRHFGGGMVVAEHASIDDACLDLFALEPVGLLAYLALLPRLRSGRHGALNHVRTWRGREITIHTVPPLPINTDGEITTMTPARFRVRPKALAVLVPKEA